MNKIATNVLLVVDDDPENIFEEKKMSEKKPAITTEGEAKTDAERAKPE